MTPYGFRDFVTDLELITSVPIADEEKIRKIHRKLRLLITSGLSLPQEARQGHPERYARHLLHRDPLHRFVVVSMVWGPGQGTPIHDHSTWGVMGILENELRIVNFDRLDGGNGPGAADLRETSALEIPAGTVTYVLPPNDVIHIIENPTDKPSLSLHVYGTEYYQCHLYDATEKAFKKWSLTYDP